MLLIFLIVINILFVNSNNNLIDILEFDILQDDNINSRRLTSVPSLNFPLGLINQSKEEKNYLKLHKCRDSGEVYSAAYLITKEHILYQHTGYNYSFVNCEMGSFIMMNQRFNIDRNVNGTLIQTLDVLDFSVIHLSAYERLQRRWSPFLKKEISNNPKLKGLYDLSSIDKIEPILKVSQFLKERAMRMKLNRDDRPLFNEMNKTVVIMPFLAAENGAGHSKLGNRLHYLHACFWSCFAEFHHVVAVVKNEPDAAFARNGSGLPFWDVVLIKDLPKNAALPVATVKAAKERLQDGRWDFDYVYFTESDQILVIRKPEELYNHLKIYPRRFISPHRLMPYPEPVVTLRHERKLSKINQLDWLNMSCCMPRQNCKDRKTWISVSDTNVNIINIFGLQVPLGNMNFHEEKLRSCTLKNDGGNQICP